jgi:hypothetical protein
VEGRLAHFADRPLSLGSTSTTFACNGEKGSPGAPGSPWTAGGTLPEGATETGTWGAQVPKLAPGLIPISLPIPMAAEPEVVFVHGATEFNGEGEDPGRAPGGLFFGQSSVRTQTTCPSGETLHKSSGERVLSGFGARPRDTQTKESQR